ncbi:MAG: hypothetical protein MI725_04555 [Pirellulales bacterium]|nr:hypothetical protein [Pirellulales bacterium]
MLSSLSGCTSLFVLPVADDSPSFLKPVETSPDSVTLEIFQVRLPASDSGSVEELWQVVDELRLPLAVRRELLRNGFRAGVVGGALPDGLAAHLNLQGEHTEVSAERQISGVNADPKVTRRLVQLSRQEKAAIQVADLRESIHVFLSEDSGVRGRSYQQAQAVYSLRAEGKAGRRAALELVPELQHGQLRNRYAGGDQGIFLMTQSRERDTFDRLAMSPELAPGEMLVVGCLPDVSGSLGHAFHAHQVSGPLEYKLVLVRLLQIPGSEILASLDS